MERFCSYFNSVRSRNTIYFAKYVICEFLNVAVLAFNFWATNAFLSYKWGTYGFQGSDRLCVLIKISFRCYFFIV